MGDGDFVRADVDVRGGLRGRGPGIRHWRRWG